MTHHTLPVAAITPGTADVVVAGGGPIGTLYASLLKLRRPATRVVVLERALEPSHKVGESTLSGFCKAMRTVGISDAALERLFYPKNGLGFFHVDPATADLSRAPEYVLESFDPTYQVERRVLDGLLIANARRLGVEVVEGAAVVFERTTPGAAGGEVTYTCGGREQRITTRLLVDATGPQGLLSKKLGLHHRSDVPFQTSSVWTYCSGLGPIGQGGSFPGTTAFPRDQYTQHVCFREGWLWVIPLVSWQSSPDAGLDRLYRRVLAGGDCLPGRAELAAASGCVTRGVVSVGLTLRGDRDDSIHHDAQGTFERYLRKYPAIGRLLAGARIEPNYYGPGRTFHARQSFRTAARQVAGDGWLLIGDAAFFVDPLISPGLTGGVAGAYRAVEATVAALARGDASAGSFAGYEAFVHELHGALERDNQLVYMSFNHPEALALVQRLQEVDSRRHFLDHEGDAYGDADTNVWGILDPGYQTLQRAAWTILRDAELDASRNVRGRSECAGDYRIAVVRLRRLLGTYLARHEAMTPYVVANRSTRTTAVAALGAA